MTWRASSCITYALIDLAERVGGVVADQAERGERQALDEHLHRRGTSCPSGCR